MTAAGDLDQRIRLERQTDAADDGGGGAGRVWTLVGEVWAKAWPVGGGERREAEQTVATVRQRFRIRWRADVTADDMRVVWSGRAYAIVFVADAGRRAGFLTLDCTGSEVA